MREQRFTFVNTAELMVSLVTTPARASTIVGDLIERAPHQRPVTLAAAVLRTATALVWHDLNATPVALAFAAALAWLVYMLIALIMLLAGHLLITTGWAIASTPPPSWAVATMQTVVFAVAAPLQAGRVAARQWHQRAVAFTVMTGVVWALLIVGTPIAGMFGDRVSIAMLPATMLFMLIGVVLERLARLRRATV